MFCAVLAWLWLWLWRTGVLCGDRGARRTLPAIYAGRGKGEGEDFGGRETHDNPNPNPNPNPKTLTPQREYAIKTKALRAREYELAY